MSALREWPESERPRERLFRQGVESLTDSELLALFLRSGIPGKNVRDLAFHLLEQFQGLKGLAQKSAQELLEIPGLGPAKISTLLAAFELGRRILAKKIEQRTFIDSAQDLFDLLYQSFHKESEEVFLAVLLNAKNKIMKLLPLARGDVTQISLSIPSVLRKVLLENPAAVVFVHNHPSGDPTPSESDKAITQSLAEGCRAIGLTLHDHLIIGEKKFFSFAQEELL